MNLLQQFEQFKKEVRAEIRSIKIDGTWISEEEAMAITGYSKKTLQVMRRNKTIKYRSINGRNHRYNAAELKNLFQ